jgi:hypothetical protein
MPAEPALHRYQPVSQDPLPPITMQEVIQYLREELLKAAPDIHRELLTLRAADPHMAAALIQDQAPEAATPQEDHLVLHIAADLHHQAPRPAALHPDRPVDHPVEEVQPPAEEDRFIMII